MFSHLGNEIINNLEIWFGHLGTKIIQYLEVKFGQLGTEIIQNLEVKFGQLGTKIIQSSRSSTIIPQHKYHIQETQSAVTNPQFSTTQLFIQHRHLLRSQTIDIKINKSSSHTKFPSKLGKKNFFLFNQNFFDHFQRKNLIINLGKSF